MQTIVLEGYMGSGKTCVGKLLAMKLQVPFTDLDEVIEQREGIPIPEIFRKRGEQSFRRAEQEALAFVLSDKTPKVLALGGGTCTTQACRTMLDQGRREGNLKVWYLRVSPKTVLSRVSFDGSRPMLGNQTDSKKQLDIITRMLAVREPYYKTCADATVPADSCNEEEIVQIILKELFTMKILIMNGPNMNFLGIREPEIYGTRTYDDLVAYLKEKGEELGVELSFYQSNHEGDLIDRIQQAYRERIDGVVINPAAFTHYSYALRDAIHSVPIPFVEVHISHIDQRESFRRNSVLKEVCLAQISGMGFDSYTEGIKRLIQAAAEKTKKG